MVWLTLGGVAGSKGGPRVTVENVRRPSQGIGRLPGMDDEIELLRRASVNHVFSSADAERAGIPRLRLVTLARAGLLTHLTRGMWSTVGSGDLDDIHLLRTVAIIRRLRVAAGATAHSALILHDLPLVDCDLDTVHLVRGSGQATRRGKDYTVWGEAGELTTAKRPPFVEEPLPCASVALALVHAGVAGTPRTALAAGDAAVRRELVTPREIEVAAALLPLGTPNAAAVRRALADVDGRHESPGESLTAQVLRDLGYALQPQVWIGPYRVDFLIAGTKVVVEFDGAIKYDDRGVVIAEKRREDELRRRGFVVVRLMWSDLKDPERVRRLVEAARAASAA